MKDASRYGLKHTCYACGCRFYDLSRPKAICPKCGADQAEARKSAPHPPRAAAVIEDVDPEDDVDDSDNADAFEDEEFPALDDAEEIEEDVEE